MGRSRARAGLLSVAQLALIDARMRVLGMDDDSDLASAIDMDPSNISKWRKREIGPSLPTLARVAKALEIPVAQLADPEGYSARPASDGADGRSSGHLSPNRPVPVPVRGRVAAQDGTTGLADEHPLLDPDDLKGRRSEMVGSAEVTGSCMVPDLRPGWRVFYDAEQSPADGDTVVAWLRDSDELLIKRFYERDGDVHLIGNDGQVVRRPWRSLVVQGVVFQVNTPPPARKPYPVDAAAGAA